LLAAQGKSLGHVAATMVVFGVGAVVPLVLVGLLSRQALMRWRDRVIAAIGHLEESAFPLRGD
jgi:cytochrome c biogenesis protein CcdA